MSTPLFCIVKAFKSTFFNTFSPESTSFMVSSFNSPRFTSLRRTLERRDGGCHHCHHEPNDSQVLTMGGSNLTCFQFSNNLAGVFSAMFCSSYCNYFSSRYTVHQISPYFTLWWLCILCMCNLTYIILDNVICIVSKNLFTSCVYIYIDIHGWCLIAYLLGFYHGWLMVWNIFCCSVGNTHPRWPIFMGRVETTDQMDNLDCLLMINREFRFIMCLHTLFLQSNLDRTDKWSIVDEYWILWFDFRTDNMMR